MLDQIDILNKILKNKGELIFNSTIFKRTYKIKKIRVVSFIKEISDEDINDLDKWNDYVDEIYSAIKVENYCVWIRNKNYKMLGIMAFYDIKGDEIKMKHFKEWNNLLKFINYELRTNVINKKI